MNHLLSKSLSRLYFILILLTTILIENNKIYSQSISKNKTSFDTEYLGTKMGLPSDEINKIFQDSNGFIWIATPQGLLRYDGYHLKLYSTGNSRHIGLISNQIIDIIEDDQHNLWLATDKGLAVFNIPSNEFHFYNEKGKLKLPEQKINSISLDKQGQIWIGWAGDGIDVVDPQKSIIIEHIDANDDNPKITSNWITRIYTDKYNNKWIGTWEGGLTIIDSTNAIARTFSKLSNTTTQFDIITPFSFTQGNNDHIWIGTWEQGLFEAAYKNGTCKIIQNIIDGDNSINNLAGSIVFDLSIDKNNSLWIATDGGIDYMNIDENASIIHHFKNIQNHDNIFNNVQSIICDDEGLIWAGTMGRGVEIINRTQKLFSTITLPDVNNRKSQAIHSFTNLSSNQLLIGCLSRGFGIYNLSNQKYTPYTDSELFSFIKTDINTAKCFKWDKNGNLWIGTRYNGLIKVDLKNKEYLEMNKKNNNMGFNSREVNDIFIDKNDFIWVATENGLYKIIDFSDQFNGFNLLHYTNETNDSTSLSSNFISSINQDANGFIWVSTFDGGVNKLISPKNVHYPLVFQRFRYNPGAAYHIQSENINSIYKDKKNNLLFATSGNGLLMWDAAKSSFQNVIDNNLVIYNLVEDNSNNLWMSSNKGLTKLNYNDSLIRFDQFTFENGLQGNNFIKGAAYKASFNRLIFGGYNGFNIFSPDAIKPNRYIPQVKITGVRIDNKIVTPELYNDTTLVIEYDKNSFSVEFASLAFSAPENNRYAYKLTGIDNEWRYVESNRRNATYANLNPGKYQLMIKGTNSMGLWNDTPTILNIYVKTPPFRTWWAYTIYTIIFLMLSSFIIYMFIQRLIYKRALDIEQIERTKSDKLNHFKQQLFTNISHEFLTPITVLTTVLHDEILKSPQNEKLHLMQKNIEKLAGMVKQFLNFRKSETGTLSLKIGNENITDFSKIICKNFIELAKSKRIKFTCELPENEEEGWFDSGKLDSIFHNLLSNAFKFTPENGEVKFKLEISENENGKQAIYTVTDSGRGISKENIPNIFERFYSIRSDKSNFSGFGIGLSLTKANIDLHQGTIHVESELGKGSEFTVVIPINKDAFDEKVIFDDLKEASSKNIIVKSIEKNTTVKTLDQASINRKTEYHILLVEDNEDFRGVLKEQLQDIFKVTEASNGSEAMSIARSKMVDVVISDVLMPAMDGYELCRNLKNESTTSHIPVILITAKIMEEDRLKGYEVGADSFITKPFAFETLISRIHSLLNQRQSLIEKYKNNSDLIPDIEKQDDGDELFLKKFKELLEINFSNPEFSVKILSKEMGMSNSKLYRKSIHLLNASPLEAIKQYRLAKAEQLLITKEFSISEVANKCGFNDLSYFGVCFKKQFGISASKYINN